MLGGKMTLDVVFLELSNAFTSYPTCCHDTEIFRYTLMVKTQHLFILCSCVCLCNRKRNLSLEVNRQEIISDLWYDLRVDSTPHWTHIK